MRCSGRFNTLSYSKNRGVLATAINILRATATNTALLAPNWLRNADTNIEVSKTTRIGVIQYHITYDISISAFGDQDSVVFPLHVVFHPWHKPVMANLIITYWRDIPSAVSVKIGRKEEKRMLDNRFMEAIDMAAMRGGATSTDDYLADWRRGAPLPVSDDLAVEADGAKARLEAEFTQDVIKQMIAKGGRAL